MDNYGLRERRKGRSPLTLSDTNNSDMDPMELYMQKQNAAAAETLQRDFDTFYYACNHCPRILMSLEKLRAHEQSFHPGSRPSQHLATLFPPSPSPPPSPLPLPEETELEQMPTLVPQVQAIAKKRTVVPIRIPGIKKRGLQKAPRREAILNGGGGSGGIYGCKYCHSSFASPWNLKVHLQTIHENVRPFACPTCGKSFKQRIHLLGHTISTHSNYKPFKCELCTVAFSKKWNLFDHVRKHHKGTKADLERLKFKYSLRKKDGQGDD